MTRSSPLIDVFVQRQNELRPYFAARIGETDADDVIQDTYLKLAMIEDIGEIRSPRAYIFRLANNAMLDHLRRQRCLAARDGEWHRSTAITAPSGEDVYDGVSADEAAAARDRLRRVCAALEELPQNVQLAFRRHKFDGLSHSEVAAEFGRSRSMIEKHMMQALRHLIARVGE